MGLLAIAEEKSSKSSNRGKLVMENIDEIFSPYSTFTPCYARELLKF